MAWAVRHRSVSSPRSSNRTCGFPASGSPTGFTARHTVDGQCRLVSRDEHRGASSTFALRQSSRRSRPISLVLPGSSPITDPRLLRKRARSQGPFLRRHYPASTVLWPCPTPARPAVLTTALEVRPPAQTGLPRLADLRGAMSALPLISSASPQAADLPGDPAVGPLLTRCCPSSSSVICYLRTVLCAIEAR